MVEDTLAFMKREAQPGKLVADKGYDYGVPT
jgi:hypothetical protein